MHSLIYFCTALFALLANTKAEAHTNDRPAIVFVPGAFHQAKVFDLVINDLKKAGYDNLNAVDLPSVGQVVGRERDAQAVRAAVEEQRQSGRDVLVVGNSYGCTVIGEAVKGLPAYPQTGEGVSRIRRSSRGETKPGRILGLIYLAGYIPSITEVTVPNSKPDVRDVSPPSFRYNETGKVYWDNDLANFPPEELFYNALPLATAQYWTTQLRFSSFDALNATATYIPYTGDFRVVYVVSSEDNTITADISQSFLDQPEARFVVEREQGWDHVPMLSRPGEVAELIGEYAEKREGW